MHNKHEGKPILHSELVESKAGHILEWEIKARDKFNAKTKLTIDDLKLIPVTKQS